MPDRPAAATVEAAGPAEVEVFWTTAAAAAAAACTGATAAVLDEADTPRGRPPAPRCPCPMAGPAPVAPLPAAAALLPVDEDPPGTKVLALTLSVKGFAKGLREDFLGAASAALLSAALPPSALAAPSAAAAGAGAAAAAGELLAAASAGGFASTLGADRLVLNFLKSSINGAFLSREEVSALACAPACCAAPCCALKRRNSLRVSSSMGVVPGMRLSARMASGSPMRGDCSGLLVPLGVPYGEERSFLGTAAPISWAS
mmetsp:Transcript_10951/g.23627  ORF Transcript_10951/g.23627 Transcript_10951/m.23627 type:complete len:259 (-) Transcript_10951:1350-2126(-)